ncbi:helix-turn-helix and ligand-binding sensor domain-containing protein [Flavobacterium frigidarium]|uniref:helix-turn-helix and ligand-binding sensor domain-containing protein n=1 Tax=Flavobacterium frigidarium TaxID=99286 RepID=UPI00068636BE|nr:two-component regulator propeller domain-containing protein [Flavobacterium frigidarium]
MKKIILITFLLFLNTFPNYSQELLPFVENYSKSDYKGDNQIWNIAQGNDKALYFANNHYLLRYDGIKWEKNTLPNKTIIRSVFVEGDKIYSGSYKEFGYWKREKGRMIYTSISQGKKIFNDSDNGEIWKIFKFDNHIYFQSFNEVFIFDGKKVKKIKLAPLISYFFEIDKELLVATVVDGVQKLQGDKLVEIKAWEVLKNNVVHAIEKYNGSTYFFTKKNGVYISKNGSLSPWQNPLNEVLKKANINAAKFLKNNRLVIGTANKGLFIFDFKTNSSMNINRDNVLMNNSILTITEDKENNLWLGLDNGIAYIEVNSPNLIFYDNSGTLGSVYSVVKTDRGYLLASNHGVYQYENKNFSLVPNSQGQAWSINKVGDNYLVGQDEGTFLYKEGAYSKYNSINGGWTLVKSNVDNSYLQGTYSGVYVYKDIANSAEAILLKDFLKPIKYVAQNKRNEIWAADNYRGLYRINYNEQYRTKIENITQKNGIKNDFAVKIFEFRNDILFLINHQWYTYNAVAKKLVKNELFNTNFSQVSDVVKIDENHFVILQGGLLYQVYASADTTFVRSLIQDKYYKGKIINDNLNIFKNGDNYLLNLDDGFISLKLNNNNIAVPNLKVEAFANDELVETDGTVSYNTEVNIHLISGFYGSSKPNLFYKLEDSKNPIPINDGKVTLNNLKSGSVVFTMYNHDGLKYNKVKSFTFSVATPWYFSIWMILVYIILIGVILYIYYKWNKMRYIQKLALKEEDLKHQKKILELELKAQNDLNTQQYEKHILELELLSKSSQVAGKSLSIAKQSEMIEKVQGILEKETDINKLKSEVKKAIKINAVNKHEWESFETNLNQIHNEFITTLSKKFPNLTSKDIKLCIYLKMNLSSKEIAPMMNISFRGVELHRYRLRKKLQLETEENLSQFLLSL